MRRTVWFCLGWILCNTGVHAAEDEKKPDEITFDAAVEQVEVDVLVTGDDGKFVSGLKAEDFEVQEEGKKMSILSFEERQLRPQPAKAADPASAAPTGTAVAAPEPRKFILFADLYNSSVPSVEGIKRYLLRFINETLVPTDQVMIAVFAPDRRAMILQPFTSSRADLFKAIQALRGSQRTSLGQRSIEQDVHNIVYQDFGQSQNAIFSMLNAIRQGRDMVKHHSREQQSIAEMSLETLAAVVERVDAMGLQKGRKVVIYFSDGLPIRPGQNMIDIINRRIDEYNKLVEVSSAPDSPPPPREFPLKNEFDLLPMLRTTVGRLNRVSATLYTIDARGTFRDASSDPSRPDSNLTAGEQQSQFFESQATLTSLAADTGGVPFYNRENLASAFTEIEQDNRSRYFLTYQAPAHKKGKKAKFYEIKVKCKKPGVKVRARTGYLD